jgi:hypothetical protein
MFSQTWFELGLKGGPATNFLVNSNMLDDQQFNHRLTGTYFYGAKVGINFGEHNGIAFHFGGTRVRQNFDNYYSTAPSSSTTITTSAHLFEIGALYHRTNGSGYFEVGPRLSMVQNAAIYNNGSNPIDITDDVYPNYYGIDLGFGAFVIGNDQLTLMTGFRFSYGIGPLSNSERPFIPSSAVYETSQSVHVLTGMLCIELNYSLGYLVKSTCGNRTSWISF